MGNLSLREMRMGATVTVVNGIGIATAVIETLVEIEIVIGIDETEAGTEIGRGMMLVVVSPLLLPVAWCIFCVVASSVIGVVTDVRKIGSPKPQE